MNIPRRRHSRREFNQLCATLGLGLLASGSLIGPAWAQTVEGALDNRRRTVKFRDGIVVPALGQGSWHLAEDGIQRRRRRSTAQGYFTGHDGDRHVGRIRRRSFGRTNRARDRWQRDSVFVISKVDHTEGDYIARACRTSLDRLGTNYLDLYLLHWRNPKIIFRMS